jgi:hypothetical protein
VLAGLQPAGSLLGLLEIRLARAPKDHAAGHAPDRDGDVELTGDAQEIVFHALRPNFRAQTDAGSLARERLDLLALIFYRGAVVSEIAVPAVRLRVVGLQVQGARVRIGAD